MRSYEKFTEEQRMKLIKNNDTHLKKSINFSYREFNDIEKKIINLPFDNFTIEIRGYLIRIHSSEEFKELISDLNKKYNKEIDVNMSFDLSIDKNRLYSINIDFNLPIELRGLNIGYKIYKYVINRFHFITSDNAASADAQNVWYKLLIDDDHYAITCGRKKFDDRGFVCIISKKTPNSILIEILNSIRINLYRIYEHNIEDLIFDDELKQKISELSWK